MKSYQMKNVLVECISQDNPVLLSKLMGEILPLLDVESREECYKALGDSALLAKSDEVKSLCLKYSSISPKSSLKLFEGIASGGFDGINDDTISLAISNLENKAALAVVSLMHMPDRLIVDNEDKRNNLIIDIISNISCDVEKLDKPRLYGEKKVSYKLSNRAISKSLDLLRKVGLGRSFHLDSLQRLKNLEFGVDIKLGANEIPKLHNGVLLNPELVIQAINLDRKIPIPVLLQIGSKLPQELDSKDYKEHPEFTFADKRSLSNISLSSKSIMYNSFHAICSKSLVVGFTAPAGHRIALVWPSALAELPFGEIKDDLLEKCEKMFDSLWIMREINEDHYTIKDRITARDFLYLYETDSGFAEEFKNSRFNNIEFLTSIANQFAADFPDPKRTSEYGTFNSNVSSVVKIKNHFNVLPSVGVLFATSPLTIDLLYMNKLQFNERFKLFPGLTKSITNDFTMDTYRKIADMGGYVCMEERPDSAVQAFKYALRRRSQPMYTAFLRTFDFDELYDLAKNEDAFNTLLEAFPEKADILVPHVAPEIKRKIISHSIDL